MIIATIKKIAKFYILVCYTLNQKHTSMTVSIVNYLLLTKTILSNELGYPI